MRQGPERVPLPRAWLLVPRTAAGAAQPRVPPSRWPRGERVRGPSQGNPCGGSCLRLGISCLAHAAHPRRLWPAEGRSWFLLRLQLPIHWGSNWRNTEKFGKKNISEVMSFHDFFSPGFNKEFQQRVGQACAGHRSRAGLMMGLLFPTNR